MSIGESECRKCIFFFSLSLVSISVTRVHNGQKVFTRQSPIVATPLAKCQCHYRTFARISRVMTCSDSSFWIRFRAVVGAKNEFTTLGVAGPLASRCGKVPMDYDYGTSCLWMAWGIWSFRKCPRSVYCVKIIKKHVLQYSYAGSEEKTGPLSVNLNQRLIIDNKCVHHLAL